MDEIAVEGHPQWLSLDLELSADELVAAIVAPYRSDTPQANVEAIAEVLAGIAVRTSADNPTEDDAFVLGLWAYVPPASATTTRRPTSTTPASTSTTRTSGGPAWQP